MMKHFFLLACWLLCPLIARAETISLGALPGGARLRLEEGKLRAIDAKGRTRWQIARADAKIGGDAPERRDFERDSVVFSRDKRLFALRGDEAAQIRDSATGKIRFSIALYPADASKTARQARLQLADWRFQPVTLPGPGTFVTGMAFSPDGRHFALSGWQNTEVSYRPDGSFRRIFAAGRVRVWSLQKGRIVRDFEVKGAHVRGARWTSNRRIIATCGDNRKRVFQLR